MFRFVIGRAVQAVVLLLAATFVVFMFLHIIPADPAEIMLGDMATPEAVAELRQTLGLDRPLLAQYLTYLARLAEGDLGLSIRARRPVAEVIKERLLPTVQLATMATVLAVAVGVPVGLLAAVRRGSVIETGAFAFSLLGQAMPGYWLGLILITVFAVQLGWLPVSGSESLTHSVLPTITLAAFTVGLIVRLTRSSMLEVLAEDYIRTARAKGLPEARVVRKHGLPLALIPVVTVIGIQTSTLLGGAVVTETIFAWPGLGSLAVLAISQRDYPVVQALVLLSVATFLVVNFLVDLLYLYLDPRISYT